MSAIEQSLGLAAERAGDITVPVYDKWFARYPYMLPRFVRDKTGAVRGEMLARTIEVILDFAGANVYGENFIRCEAVTHNGYGVPLDIFAKFFDCVADTLKDILANDWSPDMERDWNTLLARLTALTPQAANAV